MKLLCVHRVLEALSQGFLGKASPIHREHIALYSYPVKVKKDGKEVLREIAAVRSLALCHAEAKLTARESFI